MANSWTPSQEAAMNIHGCDLLVSAAAGSGKTSVLTERIIRALTDPDNPADLSRMLIVTFTRASAADLKAKIAKALGDALEKDPQNKHLSRQIFLLGSAQISTIDSFFQKAVKANFEQLSLPASFRLADEKELFLLKTEVLSGVLSAFYKKHDRNGEQPLSVESIAQNDFARVLDNLMSGRSDGRLHETLLDFYECFSSDPMGIDRLRICADEVAQFAKGEYFESSFGGEVRAFLCERFAQHEKMLTLTRSHLEATPDMAIKYTDVVTSDLDFCQRLLRTDTYEDARTCALNFTPHDLPKGRIQKTAEIISYQTKRNKFKADVTRVRELLKAPTEVLHAQMQETAFALSMLHSFYKEYSETLLAQKKERGVFEHNDIRALLFSLLNEKNDEPTPFAKSLSEEYDAVYIDEYQDVDLIQDRIFSHLGKGKRFMVGDIKQSIYGFRGSDPSLFAGYRRAFPLYNEPHAANAPGVCVFMSNNFRCNESVIKFANRVCAFLFSACEESIGYRAEDDLVFSKGMPKELPAGHPHPVQFAVFDGKRSADPESEEEAEGESEGEKEASDEALWVAAEISRLLREGVLDNGNRITPADIAILTPTRRPWAGYIRALEALNIPVGASLAADLIYDPVLTATLNLLRAIDNPYRDLPLTEFLLSALGGYTLEELGELREGLGSECAIYDALLNGAQGETPLAKKAESTLRWLETFRKSAAVLSADRFLRILYLDERFVPYANTSPLLFLYDRARLSQRTSFQGLYEFLASFTKLLENGKVSADGFSPAQSAVTLMSVHHSKGLEFPVVFVSSTGTQFNKDDLKASLLYHKSIGAALKLYNRESGNIEGTALHDALKLRIDTEGTEEHIRTLYVALTRARERLYVTGSIRGKWENALSSASEITYQNRSAILDTGTTLKWMLAAMQGAPAGFPCNLSHYSAGSFERGIPLSPEEKKAEAPTATDDEEALYYARIKEQAAAFLYPEALPDALPSKLAASKIHPAILDTLTEEEQSDGALEAQIETMSSPPAFATLLSDSSHATAAEIGSAMHAVLEFCDFKHLYEQGVDAELTRLTSLRFISEKTLELIDRTLLEKFRKSDLMELILKARECKREQKFRIFIPMEELTASQELKSRLAGQKLFVQGSIDLILCMEDGSLLLVDYKTDRMSRQEKTDPELYRARLLKQHRDQLSVYTRAMEALFKKAPDDVRIYSLPLGETVRLYDGN